MTNITTNTMNSLFPSLKSLLNDFAKAVHINAANKGFWKQPPGTAESIALMHSELSEALEADRMGNPPDDKIPEHSGVAAELADCIIRILDFSQGRNIDVIGAMLAKAEYNTTRPYKHGKEY